MSGFLFRLFSKLESGAAILFKRFVTSTRTLTTVFVLLCFKMRDFGVVDKSGGLRVVPLLHPFTLKLILVF